MPHIFGMCWTFTNTDNKDPSFRKKLLSCSVIANLNNIKSKTKSDVFKRKLSSLLELWPSSSHIVSPQFTGFIIHTCSNQSEMTLPEFSTALSLWNILSVHLVPSISLSCLIYLSVIIFTFLLTSTLMPLCPNLLHTLAFVCCLHLSLSHLSSPHQCGVWTAEGSEGSGECASTLQRGADHLVSFSSPR